MKSIFQQVFLEWQKLPEFFWGDPFDFRFFVALQLGKIKANRVLDIGCSVGVNVNTIDAKQRIGIDINIDSLKKGKKVYPETEFIAASGETLPFKNGIFDQIISIHTLDTSSLNPENTINDIVRTTNSGSEIFLTGNWYHEILKEEGTSKERLFGDWINILKQNFQYETRWYIRPNLKKIKLKIKRKMLKKSPKKFFKITNMDNELKKMYKESLIPLVKEPYIVKGTKK